MLSLIGSKAISPDQEQALANSGKGWLLTAASVDLDIILNDALVHAVVQLTDHAHVEAVLGRKAKEDQEIAALRKSSPAICDKPERTVTRVNLGALLLKQYTRFGNANDLQEAISCLEVALTGDNDASGPLAAVAADMMGDALRHRYVLGTEEKDIEDAIQWHETALAIRSQAALDRWPSLQGIGESLYWRKRFNATNRAIKEEPVDKAVSALTLAMMLREEKSTHRALTMTFLSLTLSREQQADAFRLACMAVALAQYDVETLIHPAVAAASFFFTSEIITAGLIEKMECLRKILSQLLVYAEAIQHIEVPSISLAVGAVESRLAQWIQSPALISPLYDDAMRHVNLTLELISNTHILHRSASQQLHILYNHRYFSTGDLAYLDRSIKTLRNVQSPQNLPDRPVWNNLSGTLRERYRLTRRQEDLKNATKLLTQCTSAFDAPTEGSITYFINLARCYIETSDSLGGSLDWINQAIAICDACFRALPDQARLAASLSGIADVLVEALCARFLISSCPDDLHDAIRIGLEAIAHHPPNLSGLGYTRYQLGIAYRLLGEHQQSTAYIQKAIQQHTICVGLDAGIDTSEPWKYVFGLAHDSVSLAKLSTSQGNITFALEKLSLAVKCHLGAAHERLDMAVKWIEMAQRFRDLPALSDAFGEALSILPHVIYLGSELEPRVKALNRAPKLAQHAALHALRHITAEQSVEWLELGRGVFWSRALQPRQSFSNLPQELVEQLRIVSRSLEVHSADEDMILRGQWLTSQFDALIEQVRSLPGMENFLKPETYQNLRLASRDGPVIIIMGDESGAFAVIIPSPVAPIQRLALGINAGAKMLGLIDSLKNISGRARAEATREMQSSDRKVVKQPFDRGLRRDAMDHVLEELWFLIMNPIVNALGLVRSDKAKHPRVWICPVGDFVFLPLHAAGVHHGPQKVSLSDFCIPSYTSSIQSLLTARQSSKAFLSAGAKFLLVAVPEAPHLAPLPNTSTEVNSIAELAPREVRLTTVIQEATVEAVASELQDTSVLHFACHGEQNQEDPLSSGFALKDGRLTVSRLMNMRMPDASVAFLSACDSAAGDRNLPDEAMHLSAAMLFLGFRSVVGTMWNMNDADGPSIMKHVYARLFEAGENATYDLVPRALDEAVTELRESGVSASRWATYVHTGI